MAAGQALTDADRQGWLAALSARLAQARAAGEGVVLSCSALKRAYRDVLRQGAPDLRLVFLHGSRELLAARIAARTDHYMPPSLLDSQLATLEPPQADEAALAFDVVQTPQQIVDGIQQQEAPAMPEFHKIVLYTDGDGRARFREERIALDEGTPQARLSALLAFGRLPAAPQPGGLSQQLPLHWHAAVGVHPVRAHGDRPAGRQLAHLRTRPALLFGRHAAAGASFDATVHGHWSRQVGDEPLVTLFVRG